MFLKYLKPETKELVQKHSKDGLYDPNYVTYDKHRRPVKVGCMKCGKELPPLYRLLPELKARRILENGSYIELMVCDNCKASVSQTNPDDDRLTAQVLAGLAIEMETIGYPPERIQEEINKYEETIKFERG